MFHQDLPLSLPLFITVVNLQEVADPNTDLNRKRVILLCNHTEAYRSLWVGYAWTTEPLFFTLAHRWYWRTLSTAERYTAAAGRYCNRWWWWWCRRWRQTDSWYYTAVMTKRIRNVIPLYLGVLRHAETAWKPDRLALKTRGSVTASVFCWSAADSLTRLMTTKLMQFPRWRHSCRIIICAD